MGIEDIRREMVGDRNKGEFYTPKHIASKMNELCERELGKEYREEFNVWDCCWGKGNLTKDFKYKNLFISTLRKEDITENSEINKEAVCKFSYDFLNDGVEVLESMKAMWFGSDNIPAELRKVLDSKDEKLIYYINPPYVGSGDNYRSYRLDKDGDNLRAGLFNTEIKRIMDKGIVGNGLAQTNLYTQFLYRIMKMCELYNNKNVYVCIISPLQFMSNSGFKDFRGKWLESFEFKDGYIFRGSEFEGLSTDYALGISLWKYTGIVEKDERSDIKSDFQFRVLDKVNGELEEVGYKNVYNLDGEDNFVDWLKWEDKSEVIGSKYTLSSGVKISNRKEVGWYKDSLGYFIFKGNSCYHNDYTCGLLSLPYSDGSGIGITKINIEKSLISYMVRSLTGRSRKDNWLYDKDELCVPNEESVAYKILRDNSFIYSLFEITNGISSFEVVLEDGSKLDVKNNFHIFSYKESIDGFKKNGVICYNSWDKEDRYGVELLAKYNVAKYLLDEAKELLESYKELWLLSFRYREEFEKEDKTFQVLRWDIGYYQVKQILNKYEKGRIKEFRELFKKLKVKLYDYVKEAGFVR